MITSIALKIILYIFFKISLCKNRYDEGSWWASFSTLIGLMLAIFSSIKFNYFILIKHWRSTEPTPWKPRAVYRSFLLLKASLNLCAQSPFLVYFNLCQMKGFKTKQHKTKVYPSYLQTLQQHDTSARL